MFKKMPTWLGIIIITAFAILAAGVSVFYIERFSEDLNLLDDLIFEREKTPIVEEEVVDEDEKLEEDEEKEEEEIEEDDDEREENDEEEGEEEEENDL